MDVVLLEHIEGEGEELHPQYVLDLGCDISEMSWELIDKHWFMDLLNDRLVDKFSKN